MSFSLSVISKSLAQPCYKCCILSVSIVLNARFTTNGMCIKNNTHIYVTWTSRNRTSTTWDLYCCLLPQCEALWTCCSAFPITAKCCFDQDVKVVSGATFTKRMCDRCGSLQKGGDDVAISQLVLRWKIYHKGEVCKEQHTNICDVNREQAIIEWSLLLFAATVWSFAYLPLELFHRNTRNILPCLSHAQWRNWRGSGVRAVPPWQAKCKKWSPLRDFMNYRIRKCFYNFWKSVGLNILNTETVQCLANQQSSNES